jgi:hypothetical protein
MILRMGLELYRSCKLYWVWLISDVNYWPTTITLGDETKYYVFSSQLYSCIDYMFFVCDVHRDIVYH